MVVEYIQGSTMLSSFIYCESMPHDSIALAELSPIKELQEDVAICKDEPRPCSRGEALLEAG